MMSEWLLTIETKCLTDTFWIGKSIEWDTYLFDNF